MREAKFYRRMPETFSLTSVIKLHTMTFRGYVDDFIQHRVDQSPSIGLIGYIYDKDVKYA